MDATRYLIVMADDYGIGPEVSRGIRELAARGVVAGTVLLVNSPYAPDAVRAWRESRVPLEMGWHPCLTLDAPVAPPAEVRSLVAPDGRLWPLGPFLTRLALGRIAAAEVEREFAAQYDRFLDLVGHPPTVVNAHQHVCIFPPVGAALLRVLDRTRPRPYLRRVREPWALLARIPGARLKRTALSLFGRWHARAQDRRGYPGQEWLAGVTDPPWVEDPAFFTRWLRRIPGRVVELGCHPGHADRTLLGRDCTEYDGMLHRRAREWHLLSQPSFRDACREGGFTLAAPAQFLGGSLRGLPHAA